MVYPYRILVVGMTRSGKTYWVREYLLRLLRKDGYRYIVYDPDEEFSSKDGTVTSDYTKIPEILEKDRWVIFQPPPDHIAKARLRVKVFEAIAEFVFNWASEKIKEGKNEKIFLIIDELSYITLAGRRTPKMPEKFQMVIKRGMKRGIGVCATTQRLKDADVDYITQSQVVVIFDSLPHDVKYIEDKLPIKLPKIYRNNVIALDLQEHEFFVYNHAHRRIYKDKVTVKTGVREKWLA